MIKLNKLNYFSSLMLSLFIASFCANPSFAAKMDVLDRVIATVNSEAIPESELNQQMQMLMLRLKQSEMKLPSEEELRKQLLEKIISEKLQLQVAKEEKIDIDEAYLNQAIEEIARRDNLTVQQLQKYLSDQNIEFKRFRETIKNEIIISKLQQKAIAPQISISASELDQFLNSPQGQDQSGAEYRVGHILIALPEKADAAEVAKAEKKAKDILAKLKAGADFQKTALSQSNNEQALNGGDLGFRKSSELPTLFAKAVPNLSVGDVSGPIKNSSGYHIIKLLEKRMGDGTQVAGDTLKNNAMNILYQRKFEELVSIFVKRLRDEAQVETNLKTS